MSLELYLDERFRQRDEFTAAQRTGKDGVSQYTEYKVDGHTVKHDDRGWVLPVNSELEEVPDFLKGLVIGVSLYKDFPANPHRERGVYRLNSAVAELEHHSTASTLCFVVIKAKELTDARELLRQIKAGLIRPEISYDGPQSGMSRDEVESQLDGLRAYLCTVKEERDLERESHRRMIGRLEMIFNSMNRSKWPIIRKKQVMKEIADIVNPKTQ